MISKIAVCYDLLTSRRLWVACPSLDDSELAGFENNLTADQGLVYLPYSLLEDINGHTLPGTQVDVELAKILGKQPDPVVSNGPPSIPDNNTNPEL